MPHALPARPVCALSRGDAAVSAAAAAAKAAAARAGALPGAVQWGQFQGSSIRFDPSAPSQRVPWSGVRSTPRPVLARPAPPVANRNRGPQAAAATDSSDLNMISDDNSEGDGDLGGLGAAGGVRRVPQAAQEGRDGADSSNDDGRDQAVRTFRRRDGVSQAHQRAQGGRDGDDADGGPGPLLRAVSEGLRTGSLRSTLLHEFVRRVQAQGGAGAGVPGGLGVVRAQLIEAARHGSLAANAGRASADLNCLLPLLMLGLQRTRPPSQQVLAMGRALRLADLPEPAQPSLRPRGPQPGVHAP